MDVADIASEVGAVLGRIHADGESRAVPSNLEQVMDAMDECLFVLDPGGTILHANQTTSRTVGRPLRAIIGRSALLLFPPRRAEEVMRLLQAMLEGAPAACAVPLVSREGAEIPVETRVVAGTWDGRPAIIGTSRNLSEKQQMATEIRRQHALLHMVLENAQVAAYQRDLIGGADYVSPVAETVFGFGLDGEASLSSARLLEHVHPDDLAALRTDLQSETAEPGTAREVIFRSRTADGRYRWILDRYRVLADADGVPIYRAGTLQDITAEHESGDALAASEERYRSAIAAMSEGLVIQDTSGAITVCNERACEILGLTAEQMRGRTSVNGLWGAIREDGSPFPGEEHPSMVALRSGRPDRGETMGVYRSDASLHWIEVNAEPMRGRDGEITSVVTTFTDVTDRRHREIELRDSAERFRALFDSSLLATCIIDPESRRFFDVNRAFERQFGYERAELLGGMRIDQITDEPDATEAGFAQLLARGSHFAPQRWVRRRDGTVFPAQVIAGSYGWQGRTRVYGQLLDVSDRVLAEAEIEGRAESFRRRFDDSREAMAILGNAGIIEINAAALALFRCPDRTAMVGRFLHEFSPQEQPDGQDSAEAARARRHAAYTSGVESFEWTHRRLDGELFHADVLLSPIKHGGSRVLSITIRDITRERESRERLEASELRQREIAGENARLLLQSQADAQTNARLLHEVNHRVKNNLSAILSVLDLERDAWRASPDKDGGRLLGDIMGRVQAMAVVHGELSSAGWKPLKISDLAHRVIRATMDAMAPGAVDVDVPASDAMAPAAQVSALGLIIGEIATNSAKHFDGTARRLRLRAEAGSDESGSWLEIRDNGPGYPVSVLRGAGWNVGLEIVRTLCQFDLRGTLRLNNDGGAVTRIVFPATTEGAGGRVDGHGGDG